MGKERGDGIAQRVPERGNRREGKKPHLRGHLLVHLAFPRGSKDHGSLGPLLSRAGSRAKQTSSECQGGLGNGLETSCRPAVVM